ncbi:hypothetical protein D3C87_2096700 [compost metagenome]
MTLSARPLSRSSRTPHSPPYKWRQAMATSSMAALPVRSPMPATVVLAQTAPASIPLSVLATASPKSL